MPAKFDFLSPGVLLREVDQSQIPVEVEADGPVIMGRAISGPGNKPVRVRNLEDFYAVFGQPVSGKGSVNNDVWREGNLQGATYGMYAAQAWLASEVSPITYVRLLGEQDPNASASGYAGWKGVDLNITGGGAFGLFMAPSSSAAANNVTGTLAAIFYSMDASTSVFLSGTIAGTSTATASCATLMSSSAVDGSPGFTVRIGSDDFSFNFNKDSDSFIRKVFNTNPQKTNGTIMSSSVNYFLGESFEESVQSFVTSISGTAAQSHGILLPMLSGTLQQHNHQRGMVAPCTGWFFSKDTGASGSYDATSMEKLFKIHSLHEGEWLQNNYAVGIKVVSLGTDFDPYSVFDVQVLQAGTNKIVEEYRNCNLNPGHANYVSKKIGDMYQEWDADQLKYRVKGEYANISDYVRVEVSEKVEFQQLDDASAAPFGFYGPPRLKGFSLLDGSSNIQDFGDFANEGVAATGSITLNTSTPATVDEATIVITDTEGAAVTFTYDKDISYVSPAKVTDTSYTIGGSGATTQEKLAGAVKNAIDLARTNGDLKITAAPGSPTHKQDLTQQVKGDAGNVTITTSDSTNITVVGFGGGTDTDSFANAFVIGSSSATPGLPSMIGDRAVEVPQGYSGSFKFPSLRLTTVSSSGNNNDNYTKKDYFGVNHSLSSSWNRIQDKSYAELLRMLPHEGTSGLEGQLGEYDSLGDELEYSFVFSLDDVRKVDNEPKYYYESGSRASGNSYSAKSGSASLITGSLINKFVAPMYGGFDGLDITEMEPFRNTRIDDSLVDKDNYTVYTLNKVLDSVSDSEIVSYDLMGLPGVNVPKITDRMIEICEDRGDALAVIDLQDNFVPRPEATTTSNGSVDAAVRTLKARNINSSYACAYYPWVRLKDTVNGNNDVIMCPPSVAAIGAMGASQAASEPWFAPAGFNRGGLSPLGGNKGPDVVGTWEHLTKDNRDSLYEANINPIARFPSTGDIVIFGQKTLQQTPSALDRINVRRLMIFLKKEIGLIADTILFDQNVEVTWNRFKAQANSVLGNVQTRLGITEYKLVLDKTTTTPDLVDRNILYAKVFVKPARSIEFIVVDFIITRSGVEF